MTLLNPNEAGFRWIKEQIRAAGLQLPVVRLAAAPGTGYPLVAVLPQSGDVNRLQGVQLHHVRTTHLVRVTSQTWDTLEVSNLDSQVFAALEDAEMHQTSGGWQIVNCYMERPYEDQTLADGQSYRYMGGYYVLEMFKE